MFEPEKTTAGKPPVNSMVSCGEMVRLYLKKNGYDGLVNSAIECGCGFDDLMPCGGEYAMNCEAGWEKEGCTCGESHDFYIVAGRKSIDN